MRAMSRVGRVGFHFSLVALIFTVLGYLFHTKVLTSPEVMNWFDGFPPLFEIVVLTLVIVSLLMALVAALVRKDARLQVILTFILDIGLLYGFYYYYIR